MRNECGVLMQRDLTPFERCILEIMCEGKSNSAIAHQAGTSTKIVENTMSRTARVFGIESDCDTNLRVLLALAYRKSFGDAACNSLKITEDQMGCRDPRKCQPSHHQMKTNENLVSW